MLSERGHDVEWLEHLTMDQFESLAESSERLAARRRLTEISDGRQIAHTEKQQKMNDYMKPLKKAAQMPRSAEDDRNTLKKAQGL